jgi:hypothetical protein
VWNKMTISYQQPEGVCPEIVCSRCGCKEFIQHEREPGKPTVFECCACYSLMIIQVTGFVSAIRSAEKGEWSEIMREFQSEDQA